LTELVDFDTYAMRNLGKAIMKTSVTWMVKLPFMLRREGDIVVSCCPVLDVWSQGETEPKAKANLVEAVRLFLEDCFERGVLDKVLRDSGFSPVKKRPRIRALASAREIQVPLPFVISHVQAQCRG
jgi:predicted RNase H-like HicB family nuclease